MHLAAFGKIETSSSSLKRILFVCFAVALLNKNVCLEGVCPRVGCRCTGHEGLGITISAEFLYDHSCVDIKLEASRLAGWCLRTTFITA